MSYFRNITSGAAKQAKAPKPYEVSLYATRDIVDPSVNATRMAEINPAAEASGAAATAAANELARPASALFSQLESQAAGDLALGGQLSADEVRQATQGERAAWASRGLVRSAPAAFSEVLNRIQFSNQRKAERRGFATQVAGMDLQRRSIFGNILESAGQSRLGSYGMAEQMRQDELTRLDSLKNNDKTAAVNLKIGKDQAAAAKSAQKSSIFGSVLGGIGKLFGA